MRGSGRIRGRPSPRPQLSEQEYLDGLNRSFDARVRKQHSGLIKHLRDEVFDEFRLPSGTKAKLDSIAVMLCSRKMLSREHSGIVVAGFGTKELYPSLETNLVDGAICGHVRRKREAEQSHQVTYSANAYIIPFAQSDMVASFMDGVNPGVLDFLGHRLQAALHEILGLVNPDMLQGDERSKAKTIKAYHLAAQRHLQVFLEELLTHTAPLDKSISIGYKALFMPREMERENACF